MTSLPPVPSTPRGPGGHEVNMALQACPADPALARSTLRRCCNVTFRHNQSRWSVSFCCLHCFHVIRDGFAWWWYRTRNTLLERRWVTKYVDNYITQVLSRHAFDLWYLYDIFGVSRRAKQVLGYVRRWQRDAAWSSRVESLSKRWLVHDAFNVWFYSLTPRLVSSTSEDTNAPDTREASSPDTSETESQVRSFYNYSVLTARFRNRRR